MELSFFFPMELLWNSSRFNPATIPSILLRHSHLIGRRNMRLMPGCLLVYWSSHVSRHNSHCFLVFILLRELDQWSVLSASSRIEARKNIRFLSCTRMPQMLRPKHLGDSHSSAFLCWIGQHEKTLFLSSFPVLVFNSGADVGPFLAKQRAGAKVWLYRIAPGQRFK